MAMVRALPSRAILVSLLGKDIQGGLPRGGDLQAAPPKNESGNAQQKRGSRGHQTWIGRRQGQRIQ